MCLDKKGVVTIISPKEKLVKQLNVYANSMTIDISTLAKGIYIVQHIIEEKTEQIKIVKE